LATRKSTNAEGPVQDNVVQGAVLGELAQVREPARVSFSYERTFQQAQFSPVKVAAWISISAGATQAEIEEALEVYEAVGEKAVASVDERFNELVERLGRAEAPAPKATRSNSSAPSRPTQSASTGGRAPARSNADAGEYEDVVVGGRQLRIRNYINQKGEPALSVQCDVPGCKGQNGKPGRASFSETYNEKNDQTYSPLQNLESALRFKGGVFCYNHRNQPQARKLAPAAFEDDDGDEPF
jgi:hypothetical protein